MLLFRLGLRFGFGFKQRDLYQYLVRFIERSLYDRVAYAGVVQSSAKVIIGRPLSKFVSDNCSAFEIDTLVKCIGSAGHSLTPNGRNEAGKHYCDRDADKDAAFP